VTGVQTCALPIFRLLFRNPLFHLLASSFQFLHGAYSGVKNDLIEKMKQASEIMDYERAIELRENIAHIEALMEQQKIVLTENINIVVFGYSYDQGWMCVQVFFVRQGKLIERDVSIFPFY